MEKLESSINHAIPLSTKVRVIIFITDEEDVSALVLHRTILCGYLRGLSGKFPGYLNTSRSHLVWSFWALFSSK